MTPQRWTDLPRDGRERRKLWRAYVLAHGFELMFGVAAISAGATALVRPTTTYDTALGSIFGIAALAWSVLYVVGGVTVVVGMLRVSTRLEVAGLIVLSAAVATNGFALVLANGWRGATAAIFYLGWAVAALVRAVVLVRVMRRIEARAADTVERGT